MDLGGWLRSLGLEQCEAAFRENFVDEKVLLSLTAEDLKDLGIGFVGHRRKLLEAAKCRAGCGDYAAAGRRYSVNLVSSLARIVVPGSRALKIDVPGSMGKMDQCRERGIWGF